MNDRVAPSKRFLVLHDYGMGSLWWWVHARSVREARETFAEVEVVDTPETVEQAAGWGLDEVRVDGTSTPAGLADLRARREAQRDREGFGALADREVVWLRRSWDHEDGEGRTLYLLEVGNDGRRLRQVEWGPEGPGVRSGPDDWIFNPPLFDLFDPDLVGMEIGEEEFETAWLRARQVDQGQPEGQGRGQG
ncbi:hypothetical protein ACGFYY_21355 [Streptomyces sp. NPDC048331]|uniref:hypothetical protein n=1 Tax=Streptomyces sp. NPDC048331 TaxID=3365534 RepID=UPI00371D5ED9